MHDPTRILDSLCYIIFIDCCRVNCRGGAIWYATNILEFPSFSG